MNLLAESTDIGTGVPLSYVARSVYDNQIVSVKLATEYDVTNCTPVDNSLPNPIHNYDARQGVHTTPVLGAQAVTAWDNLWGDSTTQAKPPVFAYSGWYWDDAIDFTHSVAGSAPDGTMSFSGVPFRNTDYTIFLVAQSYNQPGENKRILLLWGGQDEEGKSIRVGFQGDETIFMTHGGANEVSAPTAGRVQDSRQLFTFRFSQTEGLKIYVNGVLEATDPNFTTALNSFSGARMGAANELGYRQSPYSNHISLFKAVGAALSDSQREEEETKIMTEFGI